MPLPVGETTYFTKREIKSQRNKQESALASNIRTYREKMRGKRPRPLKRNSAL